MTARRMVLTAWAQGVGASKDAWRRRGAPQTANTGFEHYLQIARIAERGLLDALFLPAYEAPDLDADALSRTDRGVAFDPVMLAGALSSATEEIGFFAAADPSFDQPYNIARRFASLDHLSAGRAGWMLTLGGSANQGLNYGKRDPEPPERRQARALEFAEVVRGLWDSWDDDAFVMDRASGRFFDPAKMHFLAHEGEHFTVRGPLNISRPPQGHPPIAYAALDGAADRLAAAAEVVCTAPADIAGARAFYAGLEGQASDLGRAPDDLKVIAKVCPIVGRTASEAEDKLAEFGDGLADPSGAVLSGSAPEVADQLQAWFESGAADGFAVTPALAPSGLADFVDLVVPELQRRGLARMAYEGRRLRERLGLPRPPGAGGDREAAAAAE